MRWRACATGFRDLPLMVDANAAYELDDAPLLGELDRFNLTMIEQPLDYDDLWDHARLQKVLRTPVCLDESIHTVKAGQDAITLGACRIINIKPGRVGGHAESIRLHDLAAAHGVPVWHGGMLESGIGRAHNIHLSTLPNFSLPGDVAASRRYYAPDLIEPEIVVRPDGTIAVPRRARHRRARRRRAGRRGDGTNHGVARVRTDVHIGKAVRLAVVQTAVAVSLVLASACVPTPPPKLPEAPQVPKQQKMAWILQLEDQRLLRIDLPAPPPPPPPVKGKKPAPVVTPPPPSSLPDLSILVRDGDAQVRRRAALAIGRVRSKDGVAMLTPALADTDADVRTMAAFALGLIGDAAAESALAPLLERSPAARARARRGSPGPHRCEGLGRSDRRRWWASMRRARPSQRWHQTMKRRRLRPRPKRSSWDCSPSSA